MGILKTAGLILGAAALLAAACAFIYVCLFKAKESNMPNVARGVGLFALAGALKVVMLLLAEKVWSGFGAPVVDYGLVALLVVAMFLLMSGLGEGPA